MSLGRCKTCIHWISSSEQLEEGPFSLGGESYGFCGNEEQIRETSSKDGEADDHLIYEYYEGGSFSTGPEFGCVHHKEKE